MSNQGQWPKEAPYPGEGKAAFQLGNCEKVSLSKFLCENPRPWGQDWKKTGA